MKKTMAKTVEWTRDFARRAAPSLMMGFSMLLSYTLADLGVSVWAVLVPMLFGGFAIGLASDRAECRAATAWAGKFWSLIESDHMLEITVTHKNASTTHTADKGA